MIEMIYDRNGIISKTLNYEISKLIVTLKGENFNVQLYLVARVSCEMTRALKYLYFKQTRDCLSTGFCYILIFQPIDLQEDEIILFTVKSSPRSSRWYAHYT